MHPTDPMVVRCKPLSMQVCVPKGWTDEQVEAFADHENPTGLQTGWGIRREGNELLCGDHERVDCTERQGFVHIMLDC